MIKFTLFIIYMVLVLRLLSVLGLDSLEYIEIIFMTETFVMWMISIATIIPIMFMHFGTGRTFFTIFIINIAIRMYLDGLEGLGGFDFLFQMDNFKLLSIVIIGIGISIWVSLFFYNHKDLG